MISFSLTQQTPAINSAGVRSSQDKSYNYKLSEDIHEEQFVEKYKMSRKDKQKGV